MKTNGPRLPRPDSLSQPALSMASRRRAANVTRCANTDDRGTSSARGFGRISRPMRPAPLQESSVGHPLVRLLPVTLIPVSRLNAFFFPFGHWLLGLVPFCPRLVARHPRRHVTKRERVPREEKSTLCSCVYACACVRGKQDRAEATSNVPCPSSSRSNVRLRSQPIPPSRAPVFPPSVQVCPCALSLSQPHSQADGKDDGAKEDQDRRSVLAAVVSADLASQRDKTWEMTLMPA